ncbi:MAG: hypothetical protein Q8P67_28970 [archaeon]|nr:hypothetical protein [archaeon]
MASLPVQVGQVLNARVQVATEVSHEREAGNVYHVAVKESSAPIGIAGITLTTSDLAGAEVRIGLPFESLEQVTVFNDGANLESGLGQSDSGMVVLATTRRVDGESTVLPEGDPQAIKIDKISASSIHVTLPAFLFASPGTVEVRWIDVFR